MNSKKSIIAVIASIFVGLGGVIGCSTGTDTNSSRTESDSVSIKDSESFIGEHTHDYTVTTTEATCIEEGLKTYVCACGDSYTEEIPTTEEHTDDGNGSCTVCGYPLTPTEGIVYKIVGGTAMVSYYDGTAENVLIADSYEGLPVTEIDEVAFEECDSVRTVVIPDGITIIGRGHLQTVAA